MFLFPTANHLVSWHFRVAPACYNTPEKAWDQHPNMTDTLWGKAQILPGCHFSELNTMRPEQNGRHFADILKSSFLKEYLYILTKILQKFIQRLKSPHWFWPSILHQAITCNDDDQIYWHIYVSKPQYLNSSFPRNQEFPMNYHWILAQMNDCCMMYPIRLSAYKTPITSFNSLRPSDAYMRRYVVPSLV